MKIVIKKYLSKKLDSNKNLVVLTGDLGFNFLDELIIKFPKRVINCGLAEQNMVGIACGLAKAGMSVIIYSISNFVVMRALEHLRNGPIYHKLNVTLINAGPGFGYGKLGFSHHCTEDFNVIRSFQNIKIFHPLDAKGLITSINKSISSKYFCYIRLEHSESTFLTKKNNLGIIHLKNFSSKIVIITMGDVSNEAYEAMLNLKSKGIKIDIIILTEIYHDIKKFLKKKLKKYKKIITLEEQSLNGGFGSYFLEKYNNVNKKQKILFIGLHNPFKANTGDKKYLRKIHKIDKESIEKLVLNEK